MGSEGDWCANVRRDLALLGLGGKPAEGGAGAEQAEQAVLADDAVPKCRVCSERFTKVGAGARVWCVGAR
jgi:hypothetical protein